jgi:inorganic phosphate transporter, PiT family
MVVSLLVLVTLFVAYANGANDNFKGSATLYGSNVANYQRALSIATVATFAGCLASVYLAHGLVAAFSGKGLVPNAIAASPTFLLAVGVGAGCTVILATLTGFPISTTHGLTGALVGAGLVAAGDQLNFSALGATFVLPLMISPVLAVLFTIPAYKLTKYLIGHTPTAKQPCLCVALTTPPDATAPGSFSAASLSLTQTVPTLTTTLGTTQSCAIHNQDAIVRVTPTTAVRAIHYTSAAAVSFARGLNDTPKIVGLLAVVKGLQIELSMLGVAIAMALGGLIHSRRIAETMGKQISKMDEEQALTGNLVTAFLVIGASRLGMPVSTTHVSVGAISGIGFVNGTANGTVIRNILLSWVVTLPCAAFIAAITFAAARTTGL